MFFKKKLFLSLVWTMLQYLNRLRYKSVKFRRTASWGGQTIFWTGQKTICHFLFANSILNKLCCISKILQMSNSWTGQVPSLAQWCGRPCSCERFHWHLVYVKAYRQNERQNTHNLKKTCNDIWKNTHFWSTFTYTITYAEPWNLRTQKGGVL